MIFWAKYGTQTTFTFPLIKRGVVDLAVSADYTPAAADSAVSKDQGNWADTTNTVAAAGGTPTRSPTGWKLTLTATELTCAEADVQVVDAATKAVEDQFLAIYTYGNASAKFAGDWSDLVRLGLTGLANATPGAAGGLLIAGTNAPVTITGSGDALTLSSTGTNGRGLAVSGNGSGSGSTFTGGATGPALKLVGGATSGDGLDITTTSGDGLSILPTAGNGIVATANGTSKHGAVITGGTAGTSDGVKAVAGTGGVDIRGNITGNVTGNLSGTVTTVTTVTNQLTAAAIATGVWQDATAGDFTTASSIGKSLYTTGNAPGAASGLALVGSNVGTASSVTGAVGSVTGNVGGNVTGSVGSVTGAVGSVTGNVGGNVTGSVGSIATGGITDASFAAATGKKVIRASTAQSGGGTSITLDASASATDTIYVNCLVYLTGGTGAGQARFITAYNGTTKVATVTAWQTNPDNTSTFAILPFDAIPGATAPTAAQVATAVWTDLLAGSDFSTASSVGKLLKDDVDATVSSRMATYTQPTGFLAATFPSGTVANTTNITAAAGVALTAAYDAAKTAAQAGDSMKISVGTGAGQINVSSGIVPGNLKQINGTTVNGDGAGTPWGP